MLDLKGRTLKTFRKWNNELLTEPSRAEYLAGRYFKRLFRSAAVSTIQKGWSQKLEHILAAA